MKKKKQVVFLCTANMYRSRLAEILFNHYAREDNIPWDATSRALSDVAALSSISSLVGACLESRDLASLAVEPRDPVMMTVDEFERADLMIAMCRQEHETTINTKFGTLAKIRLKENRLRYWNIYDSDIRLPWHARLVCRLAGTPTQAPASGCEHIDFAVRSLVRELGW